MIGLAGLGSHVGYSMLRSNARNGLAAVTFHWIDSGPPGPLSDHVAMDDVEYPARKSTNCFELSQI